MKRATELDPDEVRRNTEAGMTIKKQAELYGVGERTVRKELARLGLESRGRSKMLDMELLRRNFEAGMTNAEQAKLLRTSPGLVAKRLKSIGLSRPYRRYTDEDCAIIERCLDEGWSFKEIERTYGYSQGNLSAKYEGRGWSLSQSGKHGMITRYSKGKI